MAHCRCLDLTTVVVVAFVVVGVVVGVMWVVVNVVGGVVVCGSMVAVVPPHRCLRPSPITIPPLRPPQTHPHPH